MVERTIRMINLLTRAKFKDGLTFEEIVQLAIRTVRQTPLSTLKVTLFQMHFGRKRHTPFSNLIGQTTCLVSNWEITISKYVLPQPAELQVFIFHDSNGELADYLVFNESTTRGQSVSKILKNTNFLRKYQARLNEMPI